MPISVLPMATASATSISLASRVHRSHGDEATVTGGLPPARFGAMTVEDTRVVAFEEKPKGEAGHVNAGFFVLKRSIFSRIKGDDCVWRKKLLWASPVTINSICSSDGFWQPMDTLRDKQLLEGLVSNGIAPWMAWAQPQQGE